jgi:hypothetical protein
MAERRLYPLGIVQTALGKVIAESILTDVMKTNVEGEIMKLNTARTSLDLRKLLGEPPLKVERAVEMLLHAHNHIQRVDPDGKSGAADVLWSKYLQLKRKQATR